MLSKLLALPQLRLHTYGHGIKGSSDLNPACLCRNKVSVYCYRFKLLMSSLEEDSGSAQLSWIWKKKAVSIYHAMQLVEKSFSGSSPFLEL